MPPSTLKIAMVAACPFPCSRGTPARIRGMAEALGRRGHDVHVVTYHFGDPGPRTSFWIHRSPAVRAYRSTAPGPTWTKLLVLDPLLAGTLRHVLRSHRFDVIHAHHYEGLLVADRAGSGLREQVPVVWDAHTTLESELPSYRLGLPRLLLARIGSFLDRRLPGRAAHTIAVTDRIRDRLVRAGAVTPERASVVGSGVELDAFAVPESERWTGEAGTRTVAYAGNLAEYQRIDLLLRAFEEVRRRRPDARLMIVTESAFDPWEPLARELGVREAIVLKRNGFAGLPALLAGADVVVNPRVVCDGLPQKLLNYMAAGKPTVSFDGSAVLLEHGKTGLRVTDGDVPALADAVVRLLADPGRARRLGEAARLRVEKEFSWDGQAARIEAVYEKVLGTSGAVAAAPLPGGDLSHGTPGGL